MAQTLPTQPAGVEAACRTCTGTSEKIANACAISNVRSCELLFTTMMVNFIGSYFCRMSAGSVFGRISASLRHGTITATDGVLSDETSDFETSPVSISNFQAIPG